MTHRIMKRYDRQVYLFKHIFIVFLKLNSKVTILEKNEANFGAQLKDFLIDINTLKDNNRDLRNAMDTAKTTLTQIEEFVHSANSTFGAAAGNPPLNRDSVLELIHNVTDVTSTRLNSLSVALDTLKYSQNQMSKGLEDDLRGHKGQLDQLTENWAKMTAQVVSIQNSLFKLRDTNRGSTVNNDPSPTTVRPTSVLPATESPKNMSREPLALPTDTNSTMHS